MKKLCVIGEALIDFVPIQKGRRLKDVNEFQRKVGGAPANVAAAFCKLGGEAKILTKLGKDAFGNHIIEVLKENSIDVSHIKQTETYETSLAFVSLSDDGDRDFQFYRKNSADLQFHPSDFEDDIIDDCDAIHFCSVALVPSPMQLAHDKLIALAIQKNKLISFDPNLRFALWDHKDDLKRTVQQYLKYATIIKIAEEELEFITGYKNVDDALPFILNNRCELFIFTKGKHGATLYTKSMYINVEGVTVNAVDTTGAGDSFIGAFLYKMLQKGKHFSQLEEKEVLEYLQFANYYGAYTTMSTGAMDAMATRQEIENFIVKNK